MASKTQGKTRRKVILPTVVIVVIYLCFSSYRRPEIDLSLSLKEGPGMVELVNEGFSQVKDTFKNVEQRIGLQPKQQNEKKFPELKFRRNAADKGNLSLCVHSAAEAVAIPDPIPSVAPTFTETFENNPHLSSGGYFRSDKCQPAGTTAVIIPFRNREHHLKMFLAHTHPILQKQGIEYLIIVVKQAGEETFNKNRLLNAGYNFAKRHVTDIDFDCIIFHDTDLLLENGTNIYTCDPEHVTHLCPEVDTLNYKNPEYLRINPIDNTFTRAPLFGGVMAFTPSQFELINGFSNRYWGWGMEDEDSYWRVQSKGLNITEAVGGRYTMIKHGRDNGNPANWYRYLEIMKDPHYQVKFDGLWTLDSKIIDVAMHPTHTEIEVDIGQPEPIVTRTLTLTISGFMLLLLIVMFLCFFFNSSPKGAPREGKCPIQHNMEEPFRCFIRKLRLKSTDVKDKSSLLSNCDGGDIL